MMCCKSVGSGTDPVQCQHKTMLKQQPFFHIFWQDQSMSWCLDMGCMHMMQVYPDVCPARSFWRSCQGQRPLAFADRGLMPWPDQHGLLCRTAYFAGFFQAGRHPNRQCPGSRPRPDQSLLCRSW